MEIITIREYAPSMAQLWEDMFIRYAKEDLEDTMPEEVLRKEIAREVFLHNQETGVSSIAFVMVGDTPAGFAIYQVDSPESDWCKRPGWGLVREFSVLPEFRRRGCGTKLAAYVEEKLLESTDRIYLTAHDQAAVSFWSACGYRDTGETFTNGCRLMEK